MMRLALVLFSYAIQNHGLILLLKCLVDLYILVFMRGRGRRRGANEVQLCSLKDMKVAVMRPHLTLLIHTVVFQLLYNDRNVAFISNKYKNKRKQIFFPK